MSGGHSLEILSFDTTTVGWLGANAPSHLPPELGDWKLRQATLDAPLPRVDLLVVETDAFPTLRDCERFAHKPVCPVLYLSTPHNLTELVNGLQAKDDVCMADSPLSLLAARLGKLHLNQRAMVDPLTGAQRRDAFFSYLRHWSMNARQGDPLSLILADLDHFKALNDQHGRGDGDNVLNRFGQVLREICVDSPLVARLGGQEFGILMPTDDRTAAETAETIRARVAEDSLHPTSQTTVSIGVACRQDVEQMDALHGVADEALYAAKAAGRNRVSVYSRLTTQSMLNGEDPDLVSLENKSRVLGERVSNFVAQRSRRILQNLRAEAETDGLTKFYTRRYLDRRLDIQFRHHRENAQPLSIALIDLDYFGQFNKNYGWPTGDKTLIALGQVIRDCIRLDNDWVGRYGGEEFCVVLPSVNLENAITICERLRKTAAAIELSSTSGAPLRITLSIGVVQCDELDHSAADLIERLSKQTLRAKETGRNRVCWEAYREPNEEYSSVQDDDSSGWANTA